MEDMMIVGVPKEIKDQEYRVGMTPACVDMLKKAGHDMLVEKGAGLGSAFGDEEYVAAGAEMVGSADEVFKRADMIVKVKEPLEPEFARLRENQVLFTYLHLASGPSLTKALLETKCIGFAYETIETDDGDLPLLNPMSEVAGRLSVQAGAHFLERPFGGRGVLLGGVTGVLPAKVIVIGAGIVGLNAAQMAIGLGADVTILTTSADRLSPVKALYFRRMKTLNMTPHNIRESLKEADLVIGAVLITGDEAPKIITRDMLKIMKKGSVIVDVSIDQGGIAETSKPTYHSDPVYVVDGIIHYCVANMPGCVPRTSTIALTNETAPYAVELADKGWKKAMQDNRPLARGLNVFQGKVAYKPVADLFKLPYVSIDEVMK